MDDCIKDFYPEGDIIGNCSSCKAKDVKILRHCVVAYVPNHHGHHVLLVCTACHKFGITDTKERGVK